HGRHRRRKAVRLAPASSDCEDDRVVGGRHRAAPRVRIADEDCGSLRRLDLLTVNGEGRGTLHDDVELLVPVRARAGLVVLVDERLSGLLLERGADAERSYVEVAAYPDGTLVVFGLGKVVTERNDAVRSLRGSHSFPLISWSQII